MIVLELTSQHYGQKLFIAAESVTVCNSAGYKSVHEVRPTRGCTVDDGKHNNGGWKVEETYDQVVAMVRSQIVKAGVAA